MFNCLTNEPYPAYYSFVAFNRLYQLESQVEVECSEKGVYAVCAKKGDCCWIVIANTNENEVQIELDKNVKVESCIITADGKNDCEVDFAGKLAGYSVTSIKIKV